MAKMKVKVPWSELKELVVTLLAAGVDEGDIPDIVAGALDEMVDFDALINGPAESVGDLLEAVDREVFKAATKFVLTFARKGLAKQVAMR